MMRFALIPFSAAVLLSGCSSGSTTVTPLSEVGFATADTQLDGDYSFTVPSVVRILGEGGTLSQESLGDITLEGEAGTGPITVTFDGETYVLERDEDDSSSASLRDGDLLIELFTVIRQSDYAVAVSLFTLDRDEDGNEILNSGRFVIGYDTAPMAVAQMNGTAEFDGRINAALRNGFADAFGNGDMTMTVNFDGNTVSGNGILVDRNEATADFNFAPIAISFDQTTIRANGFTGDVSIAAGNIDGTLADATYQGRFFGPEANSVGGQFTGRVVLEDEEQDTFIDGVFLGSQ